MGHSRGCLDGRHVDRHRRWKNLRWQKDEVMSQCSGLDTVSLGPWVPCQELRALGTWQKGVKTGVLRRKERMSPDLSHQRYLAYFIVGSRLAILEYIIGRKRENPSDCLGT